MHDLAPLTALGGTAPRRDRIGGLCIEERSDVALASVAARAGQQAACAKALAQGLKTAVPEVGRATFGPVLSAFWIGPEQWMVTAPFDSHEMLASQLAQELKNKASVTEQTDGWAIFDVSGTQGVDMFERLCPAPVRRMAAGDVRRSTIHHLGCFVLCLEAGQRLRVLGPRSSAGSLHHALCTAARAL